MQRSRFCNGSCQRRQKRRRIKACSRVVEASEVTAAPSAPMQLRACCICGTALPPSSSSLVAHRPDTDYLQGVHQQQSVRSPTMALRWWWSRQGRPAWFGKVIALCIVPSFGSKMPFLLLLRSHPRLLFCAMPGGARARAQMGRGLKVLRGPKGGINQTGTCVPRSLLCYSGASGILRVSCFTLTLLVGQTVSDVPCCWDALVRRCRSTISEFQCLPQY
jgi:hypothetical protein